MLLRASAKTAGREVDLRIVLGENREQSSVDQARALIDFVEGFMKRDSAELAGARQALAEEMGPVAMVDVAAVAAAFQRMVRIADSTGLPLDGPVIKMAQGIPEQLGLRRFASAQNTPQS